MATDRYDYVIVGGGMTADAAVRGIRQVDGRGSIVLLSEEPHPPYNRPPLSKALWRGLAEEKIWRRTDELGVELRLGRRAVRLDVRSRTVTDDAGAEVRYGKLLLATGGRPRRLPLGDGILYFRTLRDYRRLREWAQPGRTVAVLGGGFIGSELAAALVGQGVRVVLCFPERGIGARLFPADLAEFLNGFYRERGVDVRPGTLVVGAEARGAGYALRTKGGGTIEADAVVAGIGIVPETSLAESAGLRVEDGIVVDAECRASAPDVFAAGDVARFPSPHLGTLVRVEHEDNANTQGVHAGRGMAGELAPYTHLPYFYSDLFEMGYEAVGELDPNLETVADWAEPHRRGVVYYLREGRVRGVLLWNVRGRLAAARRLLAEPGPFRPEDLRGRISGT